MILIRYGTWYGNHRDISNWDRYCAFIISLLYLPTFRARGLLTVIEAVIEFRKDFPLDEAHEGIIGTGAIEYFGWISLFIIISLPVLVGGCFVYITNTLLVTVVSCVTFPGIYAIMKGIRLTSDNLNDTEEAATAIFGIMTLYGLPFVVVTIVCTMEFYAGGNWVKAYRTGFFGEYCEKHDYFAFSKWNEYDGDIRFLIISWFLF